MAPKLRARRPRPDESGELGLDGAKIAPPLPEDGGSAAEERGTEAAVEESDKSGHCRPARHAPAAASPEPKETPERGKKPPPPPPLEHVGGKGSGEASPVRDAPPDELAAAAPPPRKKSKIKKVSKRVKRPLAPSLEELAQEEVEDFGDPSLVSNATAKEATAASSGHGIVTFPDHTRRGPVSPTRKLARRGPPPREEEQAQKHPAGADEDGTTDPPAETGMLAVKANHKKKKKKLQKVLPKPPQPECAELGITRNREESGARNASFPPEKESAQEEEQQGEIVEQDHASDTSLPQVKDGAHEKEQQWEDVADTDHANTSSPQVSDGIHEEEQQRKDVAEQEHADNTSFPQQKDGNHEQEGTRAEVSGEALLEGNALLHKLRTSKGEKKPAVERSWSQDDELKILTSLVEHAQSHGGALPDLSDLFANLTFDKTDANADRLHDKIRKLKARFRRLSSQGPPNDDLCRRLFELSHILWAEVDNDVPVEATFGTRDFNQLSELYPYLAKEVKVYAETHSFGDLIMAAFTTIGDEKARHLDAMCKKQRVDAFNLELSQAILTKEVLSALSIRIN